MPDHVVRHKNKGIAPALISVPEGAEDQLEERVAALGPDWSLDKKTDPADVPMGELPAPPSATEKGN